MEQASFNHQSVLLEELVSSLNLKVGDTVVDCTAGMGGHSQRILDTIGAQGQLVCIDQDPFATSFLEKKFETNVREKQVFIVQDRFSHLKKILEQLPLQEQPAAILADIGISSPQLDNANRGFSFNQEGFLDMRMDPTNEDTLPAYALIKELEAQELTRIFRVYGEEEHAGLIASAIVKQRQKSDINKTTELAELVSRTIPWRLGKSSHPATKIFQALRIFINGELDELEHFLPSAFSLLKTKGRLAVISFHSLEDRIVKDFFQKKAKGDRLQINMLRQLPLTEAEIKQKIGVEAKIIKPFPMTAGEAETHLNRRSRSAKLRVLEKDTPDHAIIY